MNKKIAIIFFVAFAINFAFAEYVSAPQARYAAYNFTQLMGHGLSSQFDLIEFDQSSNLSNLHIFTFGGGKGFVIMSADDRVQPVLAYSFENALDIEVSGVYELLQAYSHQITSYATQPTSEDHDARSQWELLLADEFDGGRVYSRGHQAEPLIYTEWGNTYPYNIACPYDSVSDSYVNPGSEAVAMAQLLCYWQRPSQGIGTHSYMDSTYGPQAASFASTTYQWNIMPRNLEDWYSSFVLNAVTQLIHQCGVAMEMQYDLVQSRAQLVASDTADHHSMQNALWRHFGFKNSVHPIYNDSLSGAQWTDSIYHEIDQARPVPCCSYLPTGDAHFTYLIDGYDPVGRFHVNWGWGGTANGYYFLDMLPQYGYHQVMLAGTEPIGALRCNGAAYRFSFSGGTCSPHIFSDTTSVSPWTAFSSASWITISPTSGHDPIDTLTIMVDTNYAYVDRTAFIVVQQGNDTLHIDIFQRANYLPDISRHTIDTIVMTCSNARPGNIDTLYPGVRYVIMNPGDTLTYPSPCNSWVNMQSLGGAIIVDSVIYDIKQDSDYLEINDNNYWWWAPYTFNGQGRQYDLPIYGNSATVYFHTDCYEPSWGYRIFLHVCDTSQVECRNVTAVVTSSDAVRLLWTDTVYSGPWYVFAGDNPYDLHLVDSTNQTTYDMLGVDVFNTTYYSVYRHPNSDFCGKLASPVGPCDNQPFHDVYAVNEHPHSADVVWGDYSTSPMWYVAWHIDGDTNIFIDSTTAPYMHFDSLVNGTWYQVSISNHSVTDALSFRCTVVYIFTPLCEEESISCRDITIDSVTSSSARVTWSEYGTGTHWQVVLDDDDGFRDTISCDSLVCILSGLNKGRWYRVAVYNNTDMPLGDICAIWEYFVTPCVSDQRCIEYTNFYSCMVTATIGDVGNPYIWEYVWDEGPTNPNSHHTVYRDSDSLLTDPRTGGLLRIIPAGDTATVRLGNWLSNAGAESITYAFDVDTSYYDLLTMRYAAVLENPGHNSVNQPRFTFRIKDEYGNDINAGCYSADFVADSALGWNVYGHVLWKDWTNVGIDLDPLHGQRIYVQLTTYDCAEGSHFGYAYFNFHCGDKNLTADRCGAGVSTISAPEGFNYQWRDITTDSVVSTNRIINITQSDNLYCHLSFVGANSDSCGFDMLASSAFRFPNASFGYELTDTIDCQQLIRFSDSSFVSHFINSTYQTHNQCDDVLWSFGDGDYSTQRNPEHLFSWGEYDVVQVVSIDSGQCSDTTAMHLVVMPTCPVYDTIRHVLCPGDTLQFYGLSLTDSGSFTLVDGMFYHTAIIVFGTSYSMVSDTIVQNQLPYTFNGVTFNDTVHNQLVTITSANANGCDSVITYSLFYYPNVRTYIDTVVCPNDVPLDWNGVLIADDYHDSVTLITVHGSDSVVHLTLTVARDLKASIGLNRRSVNLDNYCDIHLSNHSIGDTLHTWYLPDGTDTRSHFQYCYPINYGFDSIAVMLVVESAFGCLDTDQAIIQLDVPSIYVPNVFTPTLSTNNRFFFSGNRIATLSVDIYDRRGVFLYHWDGIDGFWDGTSSGVELPQGAYVWHARYTTLSAPSEVLTLTGTVVLLR